MAAEPTATSSPARSRARPSLEPGQLGSEEIGFSAPLSRSHSPQPEHTSQSIPIGAMRSMDDSLQISLPQPASDDFSPGATRLIHSASSDSIVPGAPSPSALGASPLSQASDVTVNDSVSYLWPSGVSPHPHHSHHPPMLEPIMERAPRNNELNTASSLNSVSSNHSSPTSSSPSAASLLQRANSDGRVLPTSTASLSVSASASARKEGERGDENHLPVARALSHSQPQLTPVITYHSQPPVPHTHSGHHHTGHSTLHHTNSHSHHQLHSHSHSHHHSQLPADSQSQSSTNANKVRAAVEESPDAKWARYAVKLGSGTFKDVWLGIDTETGKEVAWNVIDFRRVQAKDQRRIRMETELLTRLRHPHIIEIYDVWENLSKHELCFITQKSSYTLKQHIANLHPAKIKVIKKYCRQILSALVYLHGLKPPIIHRDIKCIAAGSRVSVRHGLSQRIETIVSSGQSIVALRNGSPSESGIGSESGLISSLLVHGASGVNDKGARPVHRLWLADGRSLDLTHDHRVFCRSATSSHVQCKPANELITGLHHSADRIAMGLDSAVDDEKEDESCDAEWSMELPGTAPFRWSSQSISHKHFSHLTHRSRSLALARITGSLFGARHCHYDSASFGHRVDAEEFHSDAQLATTDPALVAFHAFHSLHQFHHLHHRHKRRKFGHPHLVAELAPSLAHSLERHPSLLHSSHLLASQLPRAFIREWLAGVFGQAGEVLTDDRECLVNLAGDKATLADICSLLEHVGIATGSLYSRPHRRPAVASDTESDCDSDSEHQSTSQQPPNVETVLQVDALEFSRLVGFRYAASKQLALSLGCAYHRMRQLIGQQRQSHISQLSTTMHRQLHEHQPQPAVDSNLLQRIWCEVDEWVAKEGNQLCQFHPLSKLELTADVANHLSASRRNSRVMTLDDTLRWFEPFRSSHTHILPSYFSFLQAVGNPQFKHWDTNTVPLYFLPVISLQSLTEPQRVYDLTCEPSTPSFTANSVCVHNCDNIFIDGTTGDIRIGDFGLSISSSNPTSIVGTPGFLSPEIFGESYNELVDIWSFGMCVLEMATNQYPYVEYNGSVAVLLKKGYEGARPEALSSVSDESMKEFICMCLQPVDKRPSAKQLLEQKVFDLTEPVKQVPAPQPQLAQSEQKLSDKKSEDPSAPSSGGSSVPPLPTSSAVGTGVGVTVNPRLNTYEPPSVVPAAASAIPAPSAPAQPLGIVTHQSSTQVQSGGNNSTPPLVSPQLSPIGGGINVPTMSMPSVAATTITPSSIASASSIGSAMSSSSKDEQHRESLKQAAEALIPKIDVSKTPQPSIVSIVLYVRFPSASEMKRLRRERREQRLSSESGDALDSSTDIDESMNHSSVVDETAKLVRDVTDLNLGRDSDSRPSSASVSVSAPNSPGPAADLTAIHIPSYDFSRDNYLAVATDLVHESPMFAALELEGVEELVALRIEEGTRERYQKWTAKARSTLNSEIMTLLTSLGITLNYAASFIEQEVSIDDLLYLSEEDLVQFIPKLGPRRRLQQWIAETKAAKKLAEVEEGSEEVSVDSEEEREEERRRRRKEADKSKSKASKTDPTVSKDKDRSKESKDKTGAKKEKEPEARKSKEKEREKDGKTSRAKREDEEETPRASSRSLPPTKPKDKESRDRVGSVDRKSDRADRKEKTEKSEKESKLITSAEKDREKASIKKRASDDEPGVKERKFTVIKSSATVSSQTVPPSPTSGGDERTRSRTSDEEKEREKPKKKRAADDSAGVEPSTPERERERGSNIATPTQPISAVAASAVLANDRYSPVPFMSHGTVQPQPYSSASVTVSASSSSAVSPELKMQRRANSLTGPEAQRIVKSVNEKEKALKERKVFVDDTDTSGMNALLNRIGIELDPKAKKAQEKLSAQTNGIHTATSGSVGAAGTVSSAGGARSASIAQLPAMSHHSSPASSRAISPTRRSSQPDVYGTTPQRADSGVAIASRPHSPTLLQPSASPSSAQHRVSVQFSAPLLSTTAHNFSSSQPIASQAPHSASATGSSTFDSGFGLSLSRVNSESSHSHPTPNLSRLS